MFTNKHVIKKSSLIFKKVVCLFNNFLKFKILIVCSNYYLLKSDDILYTNYFSSLNVTKM